MKYMLTIFNDEAGMTQATPDQIKETMAAYGAFGQAVEDAGVYVTGEGLQPTATATTVRVRDGERLLTDGPFAETRETLAGFFLLDVEDLDAALAWAAKIPGAAWGSVEVRAVRVYDRSTAATG